MTQYFNSSSYLWVISVGRIMYAFSKASIEIHIYFRGIYVSNIARCGFSYGHNDFFYLQ